MKTACPQNLAPAFAAIRSKLSAPRSAEGKIIARPRLSLGKQSGKNDYPIITLIAPAGYGKTTLLKQWKQELDEKQLLNSWFNFDESDNNLVYFLEYWVACFQNLDPKLGQAAQSMLQSGLNADFTAMIESLLQDLHQWNQAACVILDDMHCVSNPQVHKIISDFIQRAPANLRFIIGSRCQPKLALARYRVQGKHLGIERQSLAFDLSETTRFIEECNKIRLSDKLAETLQSKTEGWATALQLVSLALKQENNIEAFLLKLGGKDCDIADYLSEIVFEQQAEVLQKFLLQSSVLKRINAELCSKLVGQKNCQSILEEIAAKNLFLFPLDRERQWYRYHHLFGEYLKKRFESFCAEEFYRAHSQAALWFFEQGSLAEAIDYALTAKNFDLAGQWIADYALEIIQHQGDNATLLNWMRQLPEAQLLRWPMIRLGYALSQAFTMQYTSSLEQLDRLEADLESSATLTGEALEEIRQGIEMTRCVVWMFTDEIQKVRNFIEPRLANLNQAQPFFRGMFYGILLSTSLVRHDLEKGFAYIEEAQSCLENCRGFYSLAWTYAIRSLFHILEGRLKKAQEVCENGIRYFRQNLGPDSLPEKITESVLLKIDYEKGHLDQVETTLPKNLLFIRSQSTTEATIDTFLIAAKFSHQKNQLQESETYLQEGIVLGQKIGFKRLELTLQAEKIRLDLEKGETARAVRYATQVGFLDEKLSNIPAGTEETLQQIADEVQARIALAQGKAASARLLLKKLENEAQRQGRQMHRLRYRLLQLRLALLEEDEKSAEKIFSEVFQQSCEESYTMLLVEEGRSFAKFMQKQLKSFAKSHSAFTEQITRLLQASPSSPIATLAQVSEAIAPVESLTKRELEILQGLHSTLSYPTLAKSLFISLHTLKWHLKNIYGKLDASCRTSAILKGKALGLIS